MLTPHGWRRSAGEWHACYLRGARGPSRSCRARCCWPSPTTCSAWCWGPAWAWAAAACGSHSCCRRRCPRPSAGTGTSRKSRWSRDGEVCPEEQASSWIPCGNVCPRNFLRGPAPLRHLCCKTKQSQVREGEVSRHPQGHRDAHKPLSILGQSSHVNSSLVKQHVPWRKNVLCFCIKYDGKADITWLYREVLTLISSRPSTLASRYSQNSVLKEKKILQ